MWARETLKARAKAAISYNYWRCVLVSFVLILFASGGSNASSSNSNVININIDNLKNAFDGSFVSAVGGEMVSKIFAPGMAFVWGLIGLVAMVMWILAACLSIFVFLPLEVSGCRFFIENAYNSGSQTTSPDRLFFAFKGGLYWNTVVTMFLRNLFTALWSLLFIIPGIVKSYEYRMIPYLLADCPELSREEAFRISKEMMDGQKLDAFVLDLSFIGWNILSAFTMGILNIFYVNPYVRATDAELFVELKRQYLAKRGQCQM